MNIGISTSVIQRGQTGIAQYVFALLRALLAVSSLTMVSRVLGYIRDFFIAANPGAVT